MSFIKKKKSVSAHDYSNYKDNTVIQINLDTLV